MTTASEILKQIKDNDVKFVDLRFTDPKGKLQHVTMDIVCVDEDELRPGRATHADVRRTCCARRLACVHELEVETVRYFHDDDAVGDLFADEAGTGVPNRLIRDIGFFLVPASRTWDRVVSFGSELFRRVVASPALSLISHSSLARLNAS